MKTASQWFCAVVFLGASLMAWSISHAYTQTASITDGDIARAIEWQLAFDEAVASHLIDVHVRDGVATLGGSADNLLAKERAGRRAEATRGVRAVINRISVKPARRADKAVETEIGWALLRDPATDQHKIQVSVENNIATLTGTVDSWQGKQLAGEVAKGIKGVVGVNNQITVDYKAQRPDADIAADVQGRLKSDVFVDAERIGVNVTDGKVTLTGEVGSAAEKSQAFADGWVAGVRSVDTHRLEVKPRWSDAFRKPAYVYRTDAEIRNSLRRALMYDPRVQPFDIDIEVRNGEAILTGTVNSLAAKIAAGKNARHTSGVWLVRNHLKVRPGDEFTDEQISKDIERALENDPWVDAGEISVRVFNKKAYLSGSVDSLFERNRAGEVAARVNGVAALQNNINPPVVRQSKADWEIQRDIEEGLRWSTLIDSREVDVDVIDGVATLSGTVDDVAEWRAAAQSALEAGAKGVINHLRVREGPPSLRG
jgi:osmotically-inducible protein OsmY